MRFLRNFFVVVLTICLAASPFRTATHEDADHLALEVVHGMTGDAVASDANFDHHRAIDSPSAGHIDPACLLGCCGPVWLTVPATARLLPPPGVKGHNLRPSEAPVLASATARPSAPPPKLV